MRTVFGLQSSGFSGRGNEKMMKACPYCGRMHQINEVCPKKPAKKYKKKRNSNEFESKYNRFLSSFAWQKAREETKVRDFYLCSICSVKGRYDEKRKYDPQPLEVHHIVPVKEDWDMRLKKDNLITLCRKHHEDAEAGLISREELKELTKSIPGG